MSNITTIKIEKFQRDRLAERGSKGKTFNEILKNLLDETESVN